MPGLAGILPKSTLADSLGQTQRMVAAMIHEPFYRSTVLSISGSSAEVGVVSIRDSLADPMVFWNETRDICLALAGEPFLDEAELAVLRSPRHSLNDTDASYTVHLYEELGPDFLQHLNGTFAGLLADLRHQPPRIMLFNDRFGLARLYYHEDDRAFYFASEAKALFAVLPQTKHLDPAGLADFFAYGCTLHNRSLYHGVHLLPPGSEWVWQSGQFSLRRAYFDRTAWTGRSVLSSAGFYEVLRDVFPKIVRKYFIAPQPIGLSLTGGLDSRMIIAALRPEPRSLECYTFDGLYRECSDAKIGRLIAKRCRQPHTVLSIESDFFALFPQLAARSIYLSDGVMDVTGAPALYLNRLAREISPIRMTGNYGGEILRGIRGLKRRRFDSRLIAPELASGSPEIDHRLETDAKEDIHAFIAFQQVPWFHYAMYSIEQSLLTVRTPFLDNELVSLSFRAPPELRENKAIPFRFVAESMPDLADIPNDRGAVWSPSCGFAPRSRFQWFREELLPKAEYAFDYGMPRWLASAAWLFGPLGIDRLFLGNQKFAHFCRWYRGELSGFLKDILLDSKALQRSHLQAGRVKAIVRSHTRGTGNHTVSLHKLLTVELIHREILERN